jgi:hypothetical protein
MSEAIPPLPQYASMELFSVKAEEQLYFTLLYFTFSFEGNY